MISLFRTIPKVPACIIIEQFKTFSVTYGRVRSDVKRANVKRPSPVVEALGGENGNQELRAQAVAQLQAARLSLDATAAALARTCAADTVA